MDLTRYDKLRSAIRRTLSPDEAAAADRALEYAAEHTASQVRHDGSPMLDHAAVEAERCVGCGKCAKLCPVGCIEVKIQIL